MKACQIPVDGLTSHVLSIPDDMHFVVSTAMFIDNTKEFSVFNFHKQCSFLKSLHSMKDSTGSLTSYQRARTEMTIACVFLHS